MFAQLFDHSLQYMGLALLSKVNSVLIDADILAHLKIVELVRSFSLVPSFRLLLV